MHLTETLRLSADPVTVARLLADPEYARAAVRASGALDEHVDVTGDADGAFTVTTRRSLPTDQIPSHVRGFVGSRLDVRQVAAWEAPGGAGERIGTVVVEIAGAPVRMHGTTALAASPDGGTLVRYDGDLRAAIPLFGSTVEQAAAGAIRAAMVAEAAEAQRWLSTES
ncbi:DUF2505 domain-containing protein [Cellulomonas composti]|uniref:DUF2505 domain-containing protein n=1 Tax=Cellulomonas composti TaxID=266130 RepID=A0A511JB57_9CELL|nr:DUF2505 domain-containing protein [Cellulomonas composti]GEL95208.1 hypothetical protein CCO02nite_18660 [Cellulomonas composti]